jgi:two-component system NarL family response regulator
LQLTLPLVTASVTLPLIARLIEVGAVGYCLKGIPSESLILALRSVAAGASWWDHTATTEIQAAFEGNNTAPSPPKTASQPEKVVLQKLLKDRAFLSISSRYAATPKI